MTKPDKAKEVTRRIENLIRGANASKIKIPRKDILIEVRHAIAYGVKTEHEEMQQKLDEVRAIRAAEFGDKVIAKLKEDGLVYGPQEE